MHRRREIMFWLATLFLLSCAIPQHPVGAVRREGSPSDRGNIYFDSYDHSSSSEDFEESGDGLRGAVLMQPEEVMEIPPTLLERDYEMSDFINGSSENDYPDESLQDSLTTRGFLNHLLEQIQTAFSKWPPGPPSEPHPAEITYYLDNSLDTYQRTNLKVLLEIVENKTCTKFTEKREAPDMVLMGTEGCSIEMVGSKIIIGYDCYEPTMIFKLVFKQSGICKRIIPQARSKSSGLYLTSFRNQQRGEEANLECSDQFHGCNLWASLSTCRTYSRTLPILCPRTCQICGDSCVDYRSDCETFDTLKDCLLNWDQKSKGCAKTCGVCKNTERKFCFDYFNTCPRLAKKGYCQKLPKVMLNFCPLSCGVCKPDLCFDERSDCSELKSMGGCQKTPGLMAKNCRRTCNLCEKGIKNRDNYEKTAEDCLWDMDFIRKFCTWEGNVVEEMSL